VATDTHSTISIKPASLATAGVSGVRPQVRDFVARRCATSKPRQQHSELEAKRRIVDVSHRCRGEKRKSTQDRDPQAEPVPREQASDNWAAV